MIVDLTLTVSPDTTSFPGSPEPQFIGWTDLKSDGYNLELLFMSSHTGTHIDAPFHFNKNGKTIHQIPVSRLVRDAILVKLDRGRNGYITRDDLTTFEARNGPIPQDCTIVFHTGWQKNLSKKDYFTKNPGLSKDAAQYLVLKKANLVGIDSPSIDVGNDARFAAHHIFAKNGVLIVENLANLQSIKGSRFSLTVLPLKLKNTSGSPVRAIGIYSNM